MTARTTPPTEYRLELPDELNRLGLYLHSGFQQMTPAETLKLQEQFDQPMTLGPKTPTAKQLTHCLAFIGFLYVEALGKAAEQRGKDVTPCD